MSRTNFAATVMQDHKGFFGGLENETREKNHRKTLRDDAEMETLRAKKGKRNKPTRTQRNQWETI